jgi:spermidine/putrescine ABC transporter ATP-binding subunit
MIIELRNLSKSFKDVVAVDDVSLGVERGEFLTMLGPSGCGKTTTLRMVGGFEHPDRGSIILDGEDITDKPPYERPLNVMFQDFALFPHMTVSANIGYGLRFGKSRTRNADKVVRDALAMIHLEDKANQKPHQLSIGQRQRVALARALVRQPKVLLLDEPLSALDAKLRDSMQIGLKHLQRETGLTFVMVTHDQSEAMVMSDRIIVMKAGRIVQIGTPDDLYDKPINPYVADFFGASNLVVGTVDEPEAEFDVIRYGEARFQVNRNGVQHRPGKQVTIAIRPERIRVLTANMPPVAGHQNEFNGTVTEQLFHGNAAHLVVDVGGDKPITIHQLLHSAGSRRELPEAGSNITMVLESTAIVVFPDDSTKTLP